MLKTTLKKLRSLLAAGHQIKSLYAVSILALPLISASPVSAQSNPQAVTDIAKQSGAVVATTEAPNSPTLGAEENVNVLRERGENLITGWKTKPDKAEGLRLLDAAIKKGDRKSLIILGRLYMDGQFLTRDRRRALDLFQRAAQLGDFEGVEALGETLMWGSKTAQDRREAERLLTMAGTAGRGSAWTTLAYGALYKKLGEAANAKYKTYVEKARELGDTQIEIVEAERLLYRSGSRRNTSKAIASLESAASKGNPDAIRYLVRLFRDGNDYNVKRSLSKARAYLKKYGPKLPTEAQQQQSLLLRAAAARSASEFASLAQSARAQTDFSSTDFQRQIYQANPNFSIYLAQETLKGKNLYQGPLNGRATTRTMASLRDACKALVWKGNCDKKLLSDRALASIIMN